MNTNTPDIPDVQAQCRAVLPDDIVAFIEAHRDPSPDRRRLIATLHMAQAHFGYLGEETLHAIAQLTGIPHAKVTGVATFYHFFRTQPRGKYMINVCLGTACYVKGANLVAERLMEELGIGFGETSSDGLFTLESTRCVGACGLAPVVMIDDQVHGPIKPDEVPLILDRYIKKARAEEEQARRG